ncbi:trinucleotide repeat-containing gene 6C protein-like [Eretmochelys imbricata]
MQRKPSCVSLSLAERLPAPRILSEVKLLLFGFGAAEQKTKVPEPIKTSLSQPQPAGTGTSTSTSTITNSSNGKRASANGQQPAASRYLPREVPPRFRQQEQKQLLKRGQPLPTGTLTGASPPQGTGQGGASPPPQPGAGGQHHPSKTLTQTDLSHSGLGDHYENSHWGQQPTFRSEANCSWDKVIDRTDKEAWPSITGTESESASECTTETDSASNCGSENSSMATGSAQVSTILVTVVWETIMKIPTGDSSPLSEVKPTAAGIK